MQGNADKTGKRHEAESVAVVTSSAYGRARAPENITTEFGAAPASPTRAAPINTRLGPPVLCGIEAPIAMRPV
jgi:hypothetical protein